MAKRPILIIGAGIGGLATGCYAQMNGYQTTIVEMHSAPGGQCTSWMRGGYTFDGCIHNLAGTCAESAFHALWQELGVVPALKMHTYEELVRVERPDGEPLIVYTDLDCLSAHMKALAPADAAVIDELIHAAHRFTSFDPMALSLAGPLQKLAALKMLRTLVKYGSMTIETFAQRFSDPFLRRALPTVIYDWPGPSMMFLLTFLGRSHIGDFGWPQGGSIAFARAIERRFHELGGEIHYHRRVASILVENGRAVGAALSDGTEIRADIVVSNANGYATIFEMLGGRYTNAAIRSYYDAPEDRIEMGVHLSLGLAREMPAEPHAIVLPLDEPVMIANEMRTRLYVEPFGFDPGLAPPGKSVLKVMLGTSYKYWEELHRSPEHYQEEKQRIVETVTAQLEKRFPGICEQIEVADVATPMTMLRFTGNGHGYRAPATAMMWALFTGHRLSQTLPKLDNFFMVGQWAGTGGVPLVAAMGRDVARAICRADGRPFSVVPVSAAT